MAGYTRNDTSNNIATGNVINAADLDGEFDALVAAFHASTGHTHDGTAANGAPITKIGPVQDLVISTGAITPKTDNTVDLGSSSFEFKDLYIDGTANIDALVADTADINAGTIDGTAIGANSASTGAFTTLSASSTVTLSGGTANGVLYLNGSKVATSGSALTFDGTALAPDGTGRTLGTTALRWGTVYAQAFADGTDQLVGSAGTAVRIGYGASWTAQAFAIGGSEQMRLTSTGLGIGTSSPSTKLDVRGTVNASDGTNGNVRAYVDGTAAYLQSLNQAANAYRPVLVMGSTVSFANNGVTNATLDSSGNLGLGVTPSAGGLSGYSLFEISAGGAALYAGSNQLLIGSNTSWSGGTASYKQSTFASLYNQQSGQHQWFTAPYGTAGNAITFTQAMTLDASGNLVTGGTTLDTGRNITVSGTGATAATAPYFTVNSTAFTGSNGTVFPAGGLLFSAFRDVRNPAYQAGITLDVYNSGGVQALANALIFRINNAQSGDNFANLGNGALPTEVARITSGGDLLVGTDNSSGTSGAGFKTLSGRPVVVNAASANTTTVYEVYSTGASAYRFYVGMGGTIYATSTTITAISDQRLKENIQDIDVGLNAVMALKPRKFDWKEGKGKDKKGDRGWIAQEFEQVFPDMITTWKDEPPEGEEPYKAVNADLIPVLVKAIQEQQALITSLTARVALLEGN